MENISTGPLNGEVGLDGKIEKPENFDHLIEPLPRRGDPTPSNLTVHRWRGQPPSVEETVDLIRRHRGGDERASTILVQNFHRLVLAIAMEFAGPDFGELVAAGQDGLLKGLRGFNNRHNRASFRYIEMHIRNAIREEAKKWKKRGTVGDTRVERYVFSHPYETPEQIAYALDKRGIRCTPEQAEEALDALDARRARQSYKDAEQSDVDFKHHLTARGGRFTSGGFTREQLRWRFNCFGAAQLSPQVILFSEHGRTIGSLVDIADKRDARWLRAMGRRAYAAWLERKDWERALKCGTAFTPLFARTPMTNCISVNTAATA